MFREIIGTSPIVVEYWMAVTEIILDDLNCTPEQKLKGMVSLLRNEAYYLWQFVVQGTQAERINLGVFSKCI